MGIDNYRIQLSNIYLIVEDGVVLLNPVYFLYEALSQLYNARAIHSLTNDYHSLPQSSSQRTSLLENQQKLQLHSLVI